MLVQEATRDEFELFAVRVDENVALLDTCT